MIHVQTKIKIPFLWGRTVFCKKHWEKLNLIVGPNGSGKTILSQELGEQFLKQGYDVDFLKLDRDASDDDLQILKTNEKIRSKIEDVLSNMFAKSIRFEEKSDGTFVPIVVNKTWNLEYDLKDRECHGLKGILKLLIALYQREDGVLIVDEPELHLHPQFQLFFMNEIRKVTDNTNRIIFLITHSPFFIDLRFPKDLIGVVVCHINRAPTYIEELTHEDYELFRKFLPRFNTYHKQFFFSDNQIFVEGYTDQQIFAKLLPFIDGAKGSAGTGIIDVGGKDELGVFFKVCSLLGTDCRIISDLDSLFQSKLREMVCSDPRCKGWLEKQYERQLPFYQDIFSKKELAHEITLELLIRKLEKMLVQVGNILVEFDVTMILEEDVCAFLEKLQYLSEKHENVDAIDTFKTVILQGIMKIGDELSYFLPLPIAELLPRIKNLSNLIFAAIEAARVYVLPEGCIEHYYTQNNILYMPISGKDRLFHTELEHIASIDATQIRNEYANLISILEKSCLRSISI